MKTFLQKKESQLFAIAVPMVWCKQFIIMHLTVRTPWRACLASSLTLHLYGCTFTASVNMCIVHTIKFKTDHRLSWSIITSINQIRLIWNSERTQLCRCPRMANRWGYNLSCFGYRCVCNARKHLAAPIRCFDYIAYLTHSTRTHE